MATPEESKRRGEESSAGKNSVTSLHQTLDGAIMARWRARTWRYLTNFDGCEFGKYSLISLRLSWLMPLKPSHNLLVRGSNPCGVP
jgi:hypothetical protein